MVCIVGWMVFSKHIFLRSQETEIPLHRAPFQDLIVVKVSPVLPISLTMRNPLKEMSWQREFFRAGACACVINNRIGRSALSSSFSKFGLFSEYASLLKFYLLCLVVALALLDLSCSLRNDLSKLLFSILGYSLYLLIRLRSRYA